MCDNKNKANNNDVLFAFRCVMRVSSDLRQHDVLKGSYLHFIQLY